MANIYPDSCMIIGLIEGDASQRWLLKKQLAKHAVFSSELVRLETRILPIRNDDQDRLQEFDRLFSACHLIPLARPVFEHATVLRARHQLKTPDTLHLAAALYAACDELWTEDKQLKAVASHFLKIVDWSLLSAIT